MYNRPPKPPKPPKNTKSSSAGGNGKQPRKKIIVGLLTSSDGIPYFAVDKSLMTSDAVERYEEWVKHHLKYRVCWDTFEEAALKETDNDNKTARSEDVQVRYRKLLTEKRVQALKKEVFMASNNFRTCFNRLFMLVYPDRTIRVNKSFLETGVLKSGRSQPPSREVNEEEIARVVAAIKERIDFDQLLKDNHAAIVSIKAGDTNTALSLLGNVQAELEKIR